jgi:hypothetical protein
MAETAFCCVPDHEDNDVATECNARDPFRAKSANVGLWRSTMNEAAKNPLKGGRSLETIWRLQRRHHERPSNRRRCSGRYIQGARYCYLQSLRHDPGYGEPSRQPAGLGEIYLWHMDPTLLHQSLMPSQLPRTFHGNLVLAHATRPIAEGEEITHSHSNGDYRDYGERTKQIQSN